MIEITQEDLFIDYYHSGDGLPPTLTPEQRYNACRAVRITHKPSGIQSSCQSSRKREENLSIALEKLSDLINLSEEQVEKICAWKEKIAP